MSLQCDCRPSHRVVDKLTSHCDCSDYPTFSFLSEWFVQRRGFANGVCFAGTAAGGLVYPFVLESLLSKYGASVTLQGLSVVTAVIFAVSLPLLRPRIPLAQRKLAAAAHKRDHDEVEGAAGQPKQKTLWKSVRLWVFMLANGELRVSADVCR